MLGRYKLASAVLASAGLLVCTAPMASAADLGGDCCADLEERIAELEATTARKGNRKVSLTISGWITQQLMGWDDSISNDVYVGTSLNDLGDRLHFDGSAKIDNDLSAGYSLRIDVTGANGFVQDANNDNGGAGALGVLNSYWWVKSKRFGRVSLGRQSHASDDTWVDLSGAGSIFAANLVIFDGQNFNLVPEGTGTRAKARWGDVATCYTVGVGIFADCAGDRTNSIRYDTPVWHGFTLATSWGEDDFWDVALRHNGEFGAFKTAFGMSYHSNTDNRVATFVDSDLFQVNFAFLHGPTGLFGSVHYGVENPDGFKNSEQLYLKGGVRAKLNTLGATVFYGEYGQDKDNFGGLNGGAVFSGVTSLCDGFEGSGGTIDAACGVGDTGLATGSTFERFGFGVVQEIDAASMALWLKYKNYGADVDFNVNGVTGTEDFEDLHTYTFGGAVFF